jgi:hypothetical protein
VSLFTKPQLVVPDIPPSACDASDVLAVPQINWQTTAVAITRLAWRSSQVEDWQSIRHQRIDDGEIMRANAATTRLVREILADRAQPQGDLFGQVSRILTDPDRVLPDGRRLTDFAPSMTELASYQAHVDTCCTGWTEAVARTGLIDVFTLLACRAATFNWHWWLSTGWPQLVNAFIQRLDQPHLWRNPWEMANRSQARRPTRRPDQHRTEQAPAGRTRPANPDRSEVLPTRGTVRAASPALRPATRSTPPTPTRLPRPRQDRTAARTLGRLNRPRKSHR